jgi:hypothetical protein
LSLFAFARIAGVYMLPLATCVPAERRLDLQRVRLETDAPQHFSGQPLTRLLVNCLPLR